MKRLYCAILILLVAGQAAKADANDPNYPNDPNELLRTKWDAVVSVLQKKDIDPTLQRNHWPKLTGPQREKFTELFVERLKSSYLEKVSLYTDETASFKPAVPKKKTLQIPMELISKEKNIAMLYKLRKADHCFKVNEGNHTRTKTEKRWKIYDVEIQGVSIILTYRAQFHDILRAGTVDDLLSKLEKPPAS
jgi:phospholipid transport system substrate-binding protein